MIRAMYRSLLLLSAALLGAVSCSTSRLEAGRRPTAGTPAVEAAAVAVSSAAVAPAALLLVSKRSMTLSVVDARGRVAARFPIACGEGLGDKRREGDRRTPEGDFRVQEILDTSRWPRPAEAEDPAWRNPYGPYFVRLSAPPHEGIGIHGTADEASIGTRSSAGCIRLRNEDLLALLPWLRIGLTVRIEPSAADEAADKAADRAAGTGAAEPAPEPEPAAAGEGTAAEPVRP